MHLKGLHSTEQSSIIKNMIAERTYSSAYSHKKSAKSFVKILDIGKLIRQNPQLRSSAAPQLSNSSVHINSQSNTYTFSHVIERIKVCIVPLCVFLSFENRWVFALLLCKKQSSAYGKYACRCFFARLLTPFSKVLSLSPRMPVVSIRTGQSH